MFGDLPASSEENLTFWTFQTTFHKNQLTDCLETRMVHFRSLNFILHTVHQFYLNRFRTFFSLFIYLFIYFYFIYSHWLVRANDDAKENRSF